MNHCGCGATSMPSTTTCPRCGAVLRPVLRGYPPLPEPPAGLPYGYPVGAGPLLPPWVAAFGAAVTVAAVAVLTVLALLVVRPTWSAVASPAPSTPAPSTPVPSTPAPSSADVENALVGQAADDHADVVALTGRWVPQLSAKRAGQVADGIVYDEAAILSDHEAVRARYPQARLVRPGDRAPAGGRGAWVTVVAEPFANAAGAAGWCGDQGLDADGCVARRLPLSAAGGDAAR